jgi:hypothetical protein
MRPLSDRDTYIPYLLSWNISHFAEGRSFIYSDDVTFDHSKLIVIIDMDPSMWKSRAVIIHRDDNGYGLTVFGDNPVSVQTIKKGRVRL